MNKELLAYFKQAKKMVSKATIEEQEIENLNTVPLLNTQCLYVYDFARNKIIYCRNAQVLGFSDDEFTISDASNYHPEDVELSNTVTTSAIHHGLVDNMLNHDCCLEQTFRLKKKDGTFAHVLKQTTIYHLDDENRMTTNTTILSDISFMNSPTFVHWSFKLKNVNSEYFEQKICGDVKNMFTKKELELIPYFIKGLKSKEIADLTFSSKHTVDTHKRNIKTKSGTNNSYDLMVFANRNKLLP